MLLRVRSKVGTWRVEDVDPSLTVAALRSRVLAEHGVTPHDSQVFSLDPGPSPLPPTHPPTHPLHVLTHFHPCPAAGGRVMPDGETVGGLGLRHGDLVHLAIREEDCAHEAGKKIAADGSIINKTHLEASRERGFRPGMMSLRSMKMHWTLTDFVELDAQFEVHKTDPYPPTHLHTINPLRLDQLVNHPPTVSPQTNKKKQYKITAQKEPWCTKALLEPTAGNNFQSYMRRLGFEQVN